MEQETKQKPWTGIAAGVLVLCLILSLALSDGGARAASAGAVLELPGAAEGLSRSQAPRWGDKVVPPGPGGGHQAVFRRRAGGGPVGGGDGQRSVQPGPDLRPEGG